MPWNNQAVSLIILTEDDAGYSGIFGYSPAEGAGNLISSEAAAAGTDPYGNSYLAGFVNYFRNEAGQFQAIQILDTQVVFYLGPVGGSEAGPWTPVTFLSADLSANGVLLAGTAVAALQPGTTATAETWHDISGSVASGWTAGTARYQLLSTGEVVCEITDLVPPASRPADGTLVWPASTFDANYAPVAAPPRQIAYYAGSAGSESPALQVTTAGGIAVYGVGSTTVTRMDVTMRWWLT